MGKRCEEVCAFCGHLDKGHCDIHNSNPMYADENHGCSYWQPKTAISEARCESCSGFRFTTPAKTWGICTGNSRIRNEIHKSSFICDLFYEEGEDMPKQTYYTKCGREFEKSTNAETTGYFIAQDENKICDIKCVECPFPIEVTEGWGENKKHVRWECRAGSKEPANLNDWQGSVEDKLTLSIRSLHNDFLESVLAYCKEQPDLSAGYNQDLADCRRAISVSCSSNKKGIAAKKALIEKFFPADETEYKNKTYCEIGGSFEEEGLFYCDKYDCPFNDRECGCQFDPEEHRDEQWHDDIGTAANRYTCENDEVVNIFNQIVEETAIKVSENENTCAGCSYLPVNGKDTCNTIHVNQKATGKCDWYSNPKTGEMGDLLYKHEYGEDKPIEKTEEYPVIETKEDVIETLETVTELTETVSKTPESVTFDYTTVDNETADFLQDKANKITEIRMKSVMTIGKELKEAQDKLANNKNGVFGAWCESIGIKKDTAYRHINAYEYIVANCEDITAADQIQPSLLFAVSKPSAPKELQEQVLSGDVKTLKEYKELEDKLKAVTYEKKMYMEQAKEAENRANAKERALAGFKEDINNYQQEIGHLNQQLNSKPLEVQATTIKEVVPAEVQAELQRLTTENRLLSEKQTSTSYTITTIIDNAASSTAEVDVFVQYAKHEIPNLPEIPVSLKDAVYKSLTFLKMAVLDLENVTRQFKE